MPSYNNNLGSAILYPTVDRAEFWRMNETSGTVLNAQFSPLFFPWATVNSPTLGVASIIPNETDTAITFNGTNQRAEMGANTVYPTQTQLNTEMLPNSVDWGAASEYQNLFMSVWVKVASTPTATVKRIYHHGDASENNGWSLVYDNVAGRGFRFSRFTNGTSYVNCDSGVTPVAGTVYHVAISYRRATGAMKIYVNGVLSGTNTQATDMGQDTTNKPTLAAKSGGGGNADVTLQSIHYVTGRVFFPAPPPPGDATVHSLYAAGATPSNFIGTDSPYTLPAMGITPPGFGGMGTPAINPTGRTVSPTGIASAGAVGTPTKLSRNVKPTGLASTGAVGTPSVNSTTRFVNPTGISSAGAVGTPDVADLIAGTIPSESAVGTPTVILGSPANQAVSAAGGIASAATVPAPNVVRANQIAVTGIASGGALGSVTVAAINRLFVLGIPTAGAVGTPGVTRANRISPPGLPSAGALGLPSVTGNTRVTPAGIVSGQVLGVPSVSGPTSRTVSAAGGIVSAEALGIPGLGGGIQTDAFLMIVNPGIDLHGLEVARRRGRILILLGPGPFIVPLEPDRRVLRELYAMNNSGDVVKLFQ